MNLASQSVVSQPHRKHAHQLTHHPITSNKCIDRLACRETCTQIFTQARLTFHYDQGSEQALYHVHQRNLDIIDPPFGSPGVLLCSPYKMVVGTMYNTERHRYPWRVYCSWAPRGGRWWDKAHTLRWTSGQPGKKRTPAQHILPYSADKCSVSKVGETWTTKERTHEKDVRLLGGVVLWRQKTCGDMVMENNEWYHEFMSAV